MKKKRSIVGDNIRKGISNWNFKGKVALNFDKHIKKSVPLYELNHKIGLKVSDFFITNDSKVLDLGCSTGSFIKKLSTRHISKKVKLIGIDNEKEMIRFAKKKNLNLKNAKFLVQDIRNMKYKNFNFITSFYTIQFLKPHERQLVINKVYDALNFGGAFLFFEKTRASNARFQEMLNLLYNDFKFEQGFKTEEIFNKSLSLKGVLDPFSSVNNLKMIKTAGFSESLTIARFLGFEGILAIK